MAIVRAVKSGNWSDVTVWNTGALPTSADDVYSNTFTVTIDISPTVLSISNASATGVTAGGGFTISANGIVLTANISIGAANTLIISVTSGNQATITGNISGNATASSITNVTFNSTGTLNIIGNITSSGTSVPVVTLRNSSSGTINITGSVTGGSQQSGNNPITNSSSGTINITGNCTGGATGTDAVINSSTGIVNITGTCTASVSTAALNNSSGTLVHVGTVQASGSSAAIGPGSTTQITILTGPFLTTATGINPVTAVRWFWANSNVTPTYYQIRTANLATIRPLYTADSVGGNPATSNVRSGTVYGPAGELTGTCAVPPAGSVALGVPVDNTTGTALITEASIANALSTASAVTLNQQTSSLTTPGSIGERLKLASTVATTAQQLSDALSNE